MDMRYEQRLVPLFLCRRREATAEKNKTHALLRVFFLCAAKVCGGVRCFQKSGGFSLLALGAGHPLQ